MHLKGADSCLKPTSRFPLTPLCIFVHETAPKSNSEFIYYGKYNKEMNRPRSYSKQTAGHNSAADGSESSAEAKKEQGLIAGGAARPTAKAMAAQNMGKAVISEHD